MTALLTAARNAKSAVGQLTTEQKNEALLAMADALEARQTEILAANTQDLAAAQGHISAVMLDRLRLTPARIQAMAQGIREVAVLPDPVGQVLEEHTRPDGLNIQKVSVPMGVIAIIYESRPNVTSDAAALALKSGNVCHPPGRQRGNLLRCCHCGCLESRAKKGGYHRKRGEPGDGHLPGFCHGADDGSGLCGFADSPGRRGAD